MLVYRCETKSGAGPYVPYTAIDALEYHNGSDKHPTPRYDIESFDTLAFDGRARGDAEDYVCGFASLKHLKAWFTKTERRDLRAVNFQFNEYDLPEDDVIEGKKQVLFLRDHNSKCKKLRTVPESEIETT